jgi:hypothetical protein
MAGSKRIAIFWGTHSPHIEDYAQRLDAELHLVHYMGWRKPYIAPFKYVLQALKTFFILFRQRPSIVYVVIPPPFSALCVFLYCRLMGAHYVMDVHGHSLTGRKWSWTTPLQKFLARHSLATVVDQALYKEVFEASGATVVMLERPPKIIPIKQLQQLDDPEQFSVTVVSIFAEDEPLDVVVEAARTLPDVQFYITGDKRRAARGFLERAPANVHFPGYLCGNAFWNRLYSSRAIMTLTTEPYSLVSGGIEAMVMGKPNLLSRQPLLETYFTKGAVFVEHTAESIAAGVETARQEEEQLASANQELAIEKRQRWEVEFQRLLMLMADSSYQEQPQPIE